jgi:hypothetical protein
MYWIVKIKFQAEDDNGKQIKFRETYLVEAITVTDAEARVTEDLMGSVIDFEIEAIQQSRITKILEDKSQAPE